MAPAHAEARAERRTTDVIVEPEGIAPSSLVCRASILLLNYGPVSGVVGPEGVAPSPLECETSILLLNYSPVVRSEGIAPSSLACRTSTLTVELRPRGPWPRTCFAVLGSVAEGGGLEPPTPVTARAVSGCGPRPAGLLPWARACGRASGSASEGRGSRTPKAPHGASTVFETGAVATSACPSRCEQGRGPPPGRPRSTVHPPSTGPPHVPPLDHAASGSASISPVQYR